MASFCLDENVAEVLGELLRRRGHDVVTTRQLSRKGSSDVQQLLFATRTGRVLVAHDARDFPMLDEAWHELAREWGVTIKPLHPGIVILPPARRLSTTDTAQILDDLVGRMPVDNRLLAWKIPTGWIEIG